MYIFFISGKLCISSPKLQRTSVNLEASLPVSDQCDDSDGSWAGSGVDATPPTSPCSEYLHTTQLFVHDPHSLTSRHFF